MYLVNGPHPRIELFPTLLKLTPPRLEAIDVSVSLVSDTEVSMLEHTITFLKGKTNLEKPFPNTTSALTDCEVCLQLPG